MHAQSDPSSRTHATDGAPAPFIVGMARSGTTMLRLLLDAHPDLAIPSETGFGIALDALDWRSAGPDDLLEAITALPTWPDLAVSRDDLREAFAGVPSWSAGAGLRAYYERYAAGQGKSRWGDKTPDHARRMRVLAEALPNAFFVHLIRDGRAVAASLRGLSFAPGDGGLEAAATAWCDTVARARAAGAALGGRYHEIRYENLVADPAGVLRELCRLIDLPFDPAMLRGHERADERLEEMAVVKAAGSVADLRARGMWVLEHTRRPPDPGRADHWRTVLTVEEVGRIEAIAGDTLRSLGYDTATSAPPRAVPAARSPGNPSSPAVAPRLRVVIATHSLSYPGGTESYALTVARELRRLGHDPVLTAPELGPVAEMAERDGLRVARTDAQLPAELDAVLAHDGIATTTLAARYPRARIVQVAHSDLYDHQLPAVLSGALDAVVVMSDRIAKRVAALPIAVPVIRLRQPIDTERFPSLGPLRARPRRALILSNYLKGDRRRALIEAWAQEGVECAFAGQSDWTLDVVAAMADVDIVVGKARVLLEAMSCGRAAYVFDDFGGDGWVTPGNYSAVEADNFAGLASGTPRTPADLREDLARYHPDMGWINRELVKSHHAARRHAHDIIRVLRGPAAAERPPAGVLDEISRLTRTNWEAERRTLALQSEVVWMRERTLAAEAEAERARDAAENAEAELESLRGLLATRRAQAGLAAGRALDRVRGRR